MPCHVSWTHCSWFDCTQTSARNLACGAWWGRPSVAAAVTERHPWERKKHLDLLTVAFVFRLSQVNIGMWRSSQLCTGWLAASMHTRHLSCLQTGSLPSCTRSSACNFRALLDDRYKRKGASDGAIFMHGTLGEERKNNTLSTNQCRLMNVSRPGVKRVTVPTSRASDKWLKGFCTVDLALVQKSTDHARRWVQSSLSIIKKREL